MPGDKRLMNPAAAAAYLGGIQPTTLAKWRCIGGGPEFTKVGGRVFYDVRVLDAWLDGRTQCSTGAPKAAA